jgi:hypothetical protein
MEKSWKPTAAGILAIIGGALITLAALAISLFVPVAAPFRYAFVSVGAIVLLWLAAGVMAIIGGIFALQRRHWGLALAGAVCALVPPATLLGIVSTVFVALAREEFETGATLSSRSEPELLSSQSTAASGPECAQCDTGRSEPSEGERNA